MSKSATAIPPSGKTGFCVKVTTPVEEIAIASASLAEPIVPPSLIKMSSTNVTIPVEATVIAQEEEAAAPMSFQEALEESAKRYLVSERYDAEGNEPITMEDIDKNPDKYKGAISKYVEKVTRQMSLDPMNAYWQGAKEAGDPIKVAWIKANLWLEPNGDSYKYPDNDVDLKLIQQFRDPERYGEEAIQLPGVDAEDVHTVEDIFGTVADAVNEAFEANPQLLGAGFASLQMMKTDSVGKDRIQLLLERKALSAGADLTQAHVQEWINVTAQDIYLDSLSALGEPDDFGMMTDDKTASWVKMNERVQALDFTPDAISEAGLKLLAEGDKKRWFGALIRQDPAMQEMFPTELDRELLAVGGFNAMRTKWIASGTDEDFTVWVTNNIATEATGILQTQKDTEGGLNTAEGRSKRFYDLARVAEWAGDKIFPENPTPFERRTMHRVLSEAEQEFIDRGSIPGTFEEIVAEKLGNWDEAVRKSTAIDRQQMGTMPPGFRPDIAMAEGLARMEARIGGQNLQAQITENEARVEKLQRNFDALITTQQDALEDNPDLPPDPGIARQVNEARVLLNDAKSKGDTYKTQLAARKADEGLQKLLSDDDQLAQAFASGNRSSLRSAAEARNIDTDVINNLVAMQGRSGLADTGAVQVATPEMLAEEARQQEIRAAQRAARTVRFDAEGNPIPPDPAEDTYNVRTGVRTDPEGNVIAPNPDSMIPGTQLPDTQENRDAIGRGPARGPMGAIPGTRPGEGFERDEGGQVLRDEEGNPVPIVVPGRPADYEPPDLILGARRPVPTPPPSVATPPLAEPPGAGEGPTADQVDTSLQEPEEDQPPVAQPPEVPIVVPPPPVQPVRPRVGQFPEEDKEEEEEEDKKAVQGIGLPPTFPNIPPPPRV